MNRMRVRCSLAALAALLVAAAAVPAQMTLATPLDGSARRGGITLTLRAFQNVTIDSFDVRLRGKTGMYEVEVHELPGQPQYSGTPLGRRDFSNAVFITSNFVAATSSGVATPLNLNLGIQMKPQETRTFLLNLFNTGDPAIDNGMIVTKTSNTGTPIASNIDLTVSAGVATARVQPVDPVDKVYPNDFPNSGTAYAFNGVVRYRRHDPTILDTAVIDVTSPASSNPNDCDPLTANETVDFTLSNESFVTVPSGTQFGAFFTILDPDGTMQTATETFTVPSNLGPFATQSFSFTSTADLSNIGSFDVNVTANIPGDGFARNDSFDTTVSSGGTNAVFPGNDFYESFASFPQEGTTQLPSGFINDPNDATSGTGTLIEREWRIYSSSPHPGGPTTDADGQGGFMTTDDGGEFDAINVLTNCINGGIPTPQTFRFAVFSNNVNPAGSTVGENQLHIDFVTNGGVINDAIAPIGHLGDEWEYFDVDLSTVSGVTQVRFRGTTNNGAGDHSIAVDDISLAERYTVDTALDAIIVTPPDGCITTFTEIKIRIRNEGTQTIPAGTMLSVDFTVDMQPPVVETHTLQSSLPPGRTIEHSFSTLPGLRAVDTTIVAGVSQVGDTNPSNDLRTLFLEGTRATAPFSENFDELPDNVIIPPRGWDRETTITSGWRFLSSSDSAGLGPGLDHTTGFPGGGTYAFAGDFAQNHTTSLVTPCIDISGLAEPYLTFFVFAGSQSGTPAAGRTLHVEGIESGVFLIPDIVPPITLTGDRWVRMSGPITTMSVSEIEIRFRVVDSNGIQDDLVFAIDDVVIGEKPPVGTPDDLTQQVIVNNLRSGESFYQEALPGDTLTVAIDSPDGGLWGGVPILVAELYPDGNPPPQDGLFPGLHFSTNAELLFNGYANPTPLGPTVVTPGGLRFNYNVPAGFDAFTVRIQTVVSAQSADNGIFAAGAAQDTDLDR